MDFIKETRKEGKIHLSYGCEGFLGKYEGEVRDSFFACNAGVTVGSILIDGSISACPSIRSDFHQGNIYQDNFMQVWEERFQPFRNRDWMKKDACAIVPSSVIARVTGCIFVMKTVISCFVIQRD